MKFRYLVIVGLILLFSGCSPTYNIEPSYNKKEKVIMIDDYKIDYVSYDNSKNTLQDLGLSVQSTFKQFKAEDEQCRRLAYVTKSIGSNGYYYTSALDEVLKKYSNNCEIEQVGNINFFKCMAKSKVTKGQRTTDAIDFHYGLTSSMSNQHGYSNKTTLILGNTKNCFVNIKEHFKAKTKPEYIKTTHNIEFDKKMKFYTGKFKAEDTICAKQGEIEFYIDNDKLKGHISFKRKGKMLHPKLWGKVVDNKIYGETIKLKFTGIYNKNTITGIYKNKVCKGTFEVRIKK